MKKANGEKIHSSIHLHPLLKIRIPIFITLKKGDEIRGCIGSLQPQTNSLAEEIQKNLKLAFRKDPRHKPIEKNELDKLEIYLTAIGKKTSVRNIHSLSPATDGALIRSGNKEAVVLPGEAKTQKYLLAFLKSKAGIKKGETFQLYRLKTATIKAYP